MERIDKEFDKYELSFRESLKDVLARISAITQMGVDEEKNTYYQPKLHSR